MGLQGVGQDQATFTVTFFQTLGENQMPHLEKRFSRREQSLLR